MSKSSQQSSRQSKIGKSGAMKLIKFATVWAFFVFPLHLIFVNHVDVVSSFNPVKLLYNQLFCGSSQIDIGMKSIEEFFQSVIFSKRECGDKCKDAIKKFKKIVFYCKSDSISQETIDKK